MELSDFTKKLIVVVFALALVVVIAIALHYDQHPAVVQCSQESKQCVDACFHDDDPLMGLNDTVNPINGNSSLLDCLAECPDSNACMSEDQTKEVEELRKWREDFKAIEKYLIHNPHNTRLVIFDEQKAKSDHLSQYLIDIGEEVQNVSIGFSESTTIGIKKIVVPIYGKWCGLNYGSGKPIDTLDSLCMVHDKCYDKRGKFACSCDRDLTRSILKNILKFKKIREYGYALAVFTYFTKSPCIPFL
jgi:hypothetical protein